MMSTMTKNHKMMDKVEELQETLDCLTWGNGVEQFTITSTGKKFNQDIMVTDLNLECEKNGDVTILMFTDSEDRLIDYNHPLTILMLHQLCDINISKDNIVLTIGAASYKITPVRE